MTKLTLKNDHCYKDLPSKSITLTLTAHSSHSVSQLYTVRRVDCRRPTDLRQDLFYATIGHNGWHFIYNFYVTSESDYAYRFTNK